MINEKEFRTKLYMLAREYNIPPDNVSRDGNTKTFYIDIPGHISTKQACEIQMKLNILSYNYGGLQTD